VTVGSVRKRGASVGTVVAVEVEDGVAVAANTGAVAGGTATDEGARRLFAFDAAVVGATGDQGDVDEFGRRIDRVVRELDVESSRDADVSSLGRRVADTADDLGVEAAVAARDDDGRARLSRVDASGASARTDTVALGTGAEPALGRLESADPGADLDRAAALARESVRAARARDPETVGDIEVAELPSRE
jgi:proteasome beta subunit